MRADWRLEKSAFAAAPALARAWRPKGRVSWAHAFWTGCFALCSLVVSAIPVGADETSHDETTRVRVLVAHRDGSVRVEARGQAPVTVQPWGKGLRVAGKVRTSPWVVGADDEITRVDKLQVRGRVEVRRTANGLIVVNDVPVASYLAGTLGNEMYAGWHAEALRAQAVVSRTYALYRAREASAGEHYELTAGTASQVYRGVGSESEPVWAAVRDTRGEILTWDGDPILAAFHSAAGGRTASSEEVWGESLSYLESREVDTEDDSPDTYWRAALSRTTLRRAVEALGRPVGKIENLEVVKRSKSGRVLEVRVEGSKGKLTLTGRDLRRALGGSTLKSTLFEIRRTDDGFTIVGSGRGHGVGMSQWGARGMAARGDNYHEILEHFFPGTRVESTLAEERGVKKTSRRSGEQK